MQGRSLSGFFSKFPSSTPSFFKQESPLFFFFFFWRGRGQGEGEGVRVKNTGLPRIAQLFYSHHGGSAIEEIGNKLLDREDYA